MKRLGLGMAAVLAASLLMGAGMASPNAWGAERLAFGAPAAADADAPATAAKGAEGAGGAEAAAKAKVAVIKLSNTLLEKPAGFSFSIFSGLGEGKAPALSQLIVTLNKAAKDPGLGGLLLDLKSFDLTLAQAEELGQLLDQVRGEEAGGGVRPGF